MTSKRRSTSLGLNDAVGSSKKIRLALRASAFAISTSWRCAAEKVAGLRIEGDRVFLAEIGEDLGRALAHRRARQPTGTAEIGEKEVLKHREIRREARLLHHHGDARVERLARAADVARSPR